MPRARFVPIAALLTIACLAAAGCGAVSKENFDKVKEGMSEAEVTAILGQGEVKSDVSVGTPGIDVVAPGGVEVKVPKIGGNAKVMVWQENGQMISVTFKDGKVLTKTWSGL